MGSALLYRKLKQLLKGIDNLSIKYKDSFYMHMKINTLLRRVNHNEND